MKILFVVLMAVVYFMFGMLIYQFIKPDITIARDTDHFNCDGIATGIPSTSGDKVICLILDSVIPLVILVLLSTMGGIVTDRVLS